MLHAVIMAGGAGTRFWPESRTARPKQLLNLVGERTMLQSTVDRLSGLIPAERILVVTGAHLAEAVATSLPELPAGSVIGEPCKRDTAPCVGLAAFHVQRHDAQAVMAVMPSDHAIEPTAAFQDALRLANDLVGQSPGRIVTFGIRPTYPAESFGYIERDEPLDAEHGVYRVARFREKPKADVAKQYVESGSFYWNSGIFVWRAETILTALGRYETEMFNRLQAIEKSYGTPDFARTLAEEFAAIRPISIDYAVMERAADIVVIEAPFSWDDVGSWQAMARRLPADVNGNTIVGKHIGLGTRGTIVRGTGDHLIATLGLVDSIVVHTPDATLVANKHDEESIRELTRLLQELGWVDYL